MVKNNSSPLISIVTVVLNSKAHLRRCIESVLSQHFSGVEHLLIDGGSTDGSWELAQEYKKHFAWCGSEPDAGISDAFNKGIQKCRGEIIGLLNADDFYASGALEFVATQMGDADVFFGDLQKWQHGRKAGIAFADDRKLLLGMHLNHPAVFIKKSAYERYGGYDTTFRYAMDYELLLRMKLAGASFKKCHTILTNMEVGGKSDQNFKQGLMEVRRAKNLHLGDTARNQWHFYRQWSWMRLIRISQSMGLYVPLKNTKDRLNLPRKNG